MRDDEPAQESDRTVDAAPDAGILPEAVTSIGRDRSAWRWSWPAKAGYVLTGVVLPVLCFLTFSAVSIGPSWQSGELGTYAQILLKLTPSVAFFPLLLYSIVAMILMVRRPESASRRFCVRAGIYTGLAVAIQYSILFSVAISSDDVGLGFLFFLVPPLVAILIWLNAQLLTVYLCNRSKTGLGVPVLIVLGVLALFVVTGAVCRWRLVLAPFFVVFAPFFCAASWAVIAYGSMSWQILRRRRDFRWQFSVAQLLGFMVWIAAYCSAWKLSIKLMLAECAKLPSTPPTDCYISTTAARGHRWLVHSRPVVQVSGKTFLANDQMRYLKAAELVLAATSPWLHRVCRASYDRLGPPAAAMLSWPLLADAAYLALKPAEWAVRVLLAVLLPGYGRVIEELYGVSQTHTSPTRKRG